ncbi:hypothetical protein Lal_00042993 [Lupinus albus]|nr:hypothetical protein Lal_00042993 [Lupinus albus]
MRILKISFPLQFSHSLRWYQSNICSDSSPSLIAFTISSSHFSPSRFLLLTSHHRDFYFLLCSHHRSSESSFSSDLIPLLFQLFRVESPNSSSFDFLFFYLLKMANQSFEDFNYQSWDSRLSEGFSLGREKLTWEDEILGYTRGYSPGRGLARLSEEGSTGRVKSWAILEDSCLGREGQI